MAGAGVGACTTSGQDLHDIRLRVPTSCVARHLASPTRREASGRESAQNNTNRFSDPLHKTGLLKLGQMKMARSQKAHTWYLDNGMPWRQRQISPGQVFDDSYSLFGDSGGQKHQMPVSSTVQDGYTGPGSRRIDGPSYNHHTFNTWERCRRGMLGPACLNGGSLKVRPAYGRRSPQLLGPLSNSISQHSLSPNYPSKQSLSPLSRSQRSSPQSLSPRSSPGHSPRGQRASFGLYNRSPQGHYQSSQGSPYGTLQGSPYRAFHGSPYGALQRSPYGASSQWEDSSSSTHSSPFPSSSGGAAAWSSREDVGGEGDTSYGSETDDEFFYVSCQQLTQGIEGLSFRQRRSEQHGTFTRQPVPRHDRQVFRPWDDLDLPLRSKNLSPRQEPAYRPQYLSPGYHHRSPNQHVLQNPGFFPSNEDYEDDDVFEDCSDDALSDDVFLDNPDPPVTIGRLSPRSTGRASPRLGAGPGGGGGEGRSVLNDAEAQAVESLRRNSLQNKRRQMWQDRRSRTSGRRNKQFSFSGQSQRSASIASSRSFTASSASSPGRASCNPSPRQNSSCQKSPGATLDTKSPGYDSEGKKCFHYVISPTDDVDMPEVIAVRKSSVELIRWQNSLRRRRRRQAKRHDLGRSKKREPVAPTVASTM